MFSTPERLVLLSAAALAFAPAAPALADVLVVRSIGQSSQAYPPGRRLADNATVNLRAGDSLTILGPAGTRVLRGPGTFPVVGPSRLSPLAREMANRDQRSRSRSRIGAVRGGDGGRSLWDLDVTRAGTFCVGVGTRPILWRPDAHEQVSFAIDSTALNWSAGSASIPWPEAVPVTAGPEYTLRLSPQAAPVRVRFATVANVPADPVDLAELLIRYGCQAQLEWLLESFPPE